jgi:hypothetical protein
MGLTYQWSLDFVWPLNLIVRYNQKHFSNWIELTPLQNKNSEGFTYAFLD